MDWSCLMWYFFPRSIYLKTRFLTQKNFKKFEVSCTDWNTQKQIQEIPKTSIPILKTQIRGRERLEGEKDSGPSDLGRPRPRRHRCASPRPGLHVAWGDLGTRALGLGCAWPGSAWVAYGGLKPPTPISIFSPFLFLGFFFFFFFLFSLGSSLMFWWFLFDLFLFIRDINRVLETWFPYNHHMEKYATSDVIRA